VRKRDKNKFTQIDELTPQQIFYEYKCSEGVTKFFKNEVREYSKHRRRVQKLVHNLIRLRNKLINTYKDFEKFISNSESYQNYNKQDLK